MPGFVDYFRKTLGWWSSGTIVPPTPGSSDSQVLASVRILVSKNVNSKILPSKQVDSKILVGLTRGEIL